MPTDDGVGALRLTAAVGGAEEVSAAEEMAGSWAATVGLSGRRTAGAADGGGGGGGGASARSLEDEGGGIRAARAGRAGGDGKLLEVTVVLAV